MAYPKNVSFWCPIELDHAIRVEAAKKDMNRSEFILEALREKLARIRAENSKHSPQ